MPRNKNKGVQAIGELRRSAVIQTFGPGAIIDFRSKDGTVSAIEMGIDGWQSRRTGNDRIKEPRLQNALGVSEFRAPPVLTEREKENKLNSRFALPVRRFPKWLRCPNPECGFTAPFSGGSYWIPKYPEQPGAPDLLCPECNKKGLKKVAVPTKFMLACERGHISDFPWDYWLMPEDHKEGCSYREERKGRPVFTKEIGEGMEGLVVECPECHARKSLAGIFSPGAMKKHGFKCLGLSPWLRA